MPTWKLTVHGANFVVRADEKSGEGTVHDVRRNFKQVARITVAPALIDDNAARASYLKRVVRAILDHYAAQYKQRELKFTILEGATLEASEFKLELVPEVRHYHAVPAPVVAPRKRAVAKRKR